MLIYRWSDVTFIYLNKSWSELKTCLCLTEVLLSWHLYLGSLKNVKWAPTLGQVQQIRLSTGAHSLPKHLKSRGGGGGTPGSAL